MKKIALEEHFLTPDFTEITKNQDFSGFTTQEYEIFLKRLLDFEDERLKTMDDAGIEIAVLSLTDPGVQTEKDTKRAVDLAKKANDYLAEKIKLFPNRYRGFAHLPLQDANAAAEELERCVKKLNFVGALINGQTNGHYLDEPQYEPFWKKLQDLDVPLYLHPGDSYQIPENYIDDPELAGAFWGWGVETATHALRIIIGGIFDKFPKTKLILGHMGETLPYLLWRFDSRWKILKTQKKLSKQPSEYIRSNIYVTTSGMCANEPLICAMNALGEDHVMFSVDYPYEDSKVASQFIENAPITEPQRQKIAYDNAKKLLKL